MLRLAIRRWPTVSWTGWCMPRTGSSYRESRCGKRRDAVGRTVPNRWRLRYFLALTPVALRAPSVSAKKQESRKKGILRVHQDQESKKTLDGCRSLFHTERALR